MSDMSDNTTARLAQSLARYQALVVAGLAFIVLFAISMMGVMLYQSFAIGRQSAKLEEIADETHDSLCALYLKEVRARKNTLEILKESPLGLTDRNGNIVIEASLLQSSIDQQQETINALKGAGLTC